MPHPAESPIISIIVPVLNEAEELPGLLQSLARFRSAGHELIVADGGSNDGSRALAQGWVDRWVDSPQGRAKQMNAGAAVARGDLLLFLHVDTRLPANAMDLLVELARTGRDSHRVPLWGRFDVRLSGKRLLFRVVERMISWRSRLTGIASGDQAMFVEAGLFRQVGGFPDLPLMEDIALSRLLKGYCRPHCLSACVVTSSRRWEEHGPWRTILAMWRLRLAYYLGADPAQLARRYYPSDETSP